jgi:uncharacterized membrane protein YdbT with pleckstrin-like domain
MSSDPAKSELPAATRQAPQESMSPATRRVPTDDTEVELWVGNYSGKEMVTNWLYLTILSIVALVVVGAVAQLRADSRVWMGVIGVLALLWAWQGLVLLYRKWSVAYRLTNQRFVHRRGLLAIRTDRIETIDIDDVAFTQGIIQRMMGVGTIRVTSTDRSDPELILRGIDKVQEVASLMDGARRKERVRRGLHIEAT